MPATPRPLPPITDAPSVDEAVVARWVRWMRAQSWSDTTIDSRVDLMRYAERVTGRSALVMDAEDVRLFIGQPGLSGDSRGTYYVGLQSWFRWLCDVGVREDDPTADVVRPRRSRRTRHPITTAHVQQLLASRMHARTRTMILLAAYQGLRASEVARVRGVDVDIPAGTLRVVGKGDVAVTLPLHPVIADEAEQYGRSWWFPQWTQNRSSRAGGPILGRSVSSMLSVAMKRARVPGSAHSLRHWYATELLRTGTDIRVIQQLMRHASLATTERYLHVDDTARRDAVLRLPDLVSTGYQHEAQAA